MFAVCIICFSCKHTCQDINIVEVFLLQTLLIIYRIINRFTISFQRNRIIATGKLCLDRGTVSTGHFLTGKNDVGQPRVLVIKGGTEERRGRSRLARVDGTVIFGAITTDILQGTDGVLFGQVFVINNLGAGRVNDVVVIGRGSWFVVVVVLRGIRFLRVVRLVAVVITAAAAGCNAYRYQDCQREVSQFH